MAAVTVAVLGVAPVSAQAGVAQVRVNAVVRMPDVLQLMPGRTETVVEAHEVVTRTTVYVSANRAWNLTAMVDGQVTKVRVEGDPAQGVRTSREMQSASGRNGTRIPVVVEYRRPVNAAEPRLEWVLGAA